MNIEALKEYAKIAQHEIDSGAAEDKLRHLLSAHLKNIFPDSPWWIQEHILGTETFLRFADPTGKDRTGFADSVVGKTAIEYEKDLTIGSIFSEGYHQVEKYCAALYNMRIPEEEILGVLSDTVRWYGYAIKIKAHSTDRHLFGADDIELVE